MKNRDKILDYFDNVADGTIVSANDMYEHGFERMNQEAFFRAVERLSDEGEIIRVGRGMYIKKSDAQGDITERPAVELDFDNTRIIEAMEIFQNYFDIPELDKTKFARYAKQFAGGYDDEAAVTVLRSMKYKKRSIAFMKKVLDTYKVPNTLSQFLSNASHYKVPTFNKLAR